MPLLSSVTANEIMDELAIRLNEVSADESAVYLGWINQCQRDIAVAFPNAPFNYTSADKTLSAGIRHYTNLPSDYEKMITVMDTSNGFKLKYLTEEEFDVAVPSATANGNPTIYTLHGATAQNNTQVEFYPIPTGQTVNYQYRKTPNYVSATSATVPIPLKYSELYVLYGTMQGLRRREDYQQADTIEQKYETLKQKMITDFGRMTEEPWRIKLVREFTQANRSYGNEIIDMFWNN